MVEAEPYKKIVTPYRMTASIAEKRIHEAAVNSDNVVISYHALERMEQRDIFDVQLFDILRTGNVIESPTVTEFNEWKCKIVKKLRGAREAGVITVIMQSGRLFIKTVEREDGK